MANRHYAKIADVWKHLPLVELLAMEHPTRYLESHAGSALYPLSAVPERDYGVRWFLDHADASPATAVSVYRRLLTGLPASGGYPVQYPGSAMLAMLLIGPGADYVFCDIDPESVANLREGAERAGLLGQTRIVHGDGRAAISGSTEGVGPADLGGSHRPVRRIRVRPIGRAIGGRVGPPTG